MKLLHLLISFFLLSLWWSCSNQSSSDGSQDATYQDDGSGVSTMTTTFNPFATGFIPYPQSFATNTAGAIAPAPKTQTAAPIATNATQQPATGNYANYSDSSSGASGTSATSDTSSTEDSNTNTVTQSTSEDPSSSGFTQPTPVMQVFILPDSSVKLAFLNSTTGNWSYQTTSTSSLTLAQAITKIPTTQFAANSLLAIFPWQLSGQELAIFYEDTRKNLKVVLATGTTMQTDAQATILASGINSPFTAIDASGNFNVFYQTTADNNAWKISMDSSGSLGSPVNLSSTEHYYDSQDSFSSLSLYNNDMTVIVPESINNPSTTYSAKGASALTQDPIMQSIASLLGNGSTQTVLNSTVYTEFLIHPESLSNAVIPPPMAASQIPSTTNTTSAGVMTTIQMPPPGTLSTTTSSGTLTGSIVAQALGNGGGGNGGACSSGGGGGGNASVTTAAKIPTGIIPSNPTMQLFLGFNQQANDTSIKAVSVAFMDQGGNWSYPVTTSFKSPSDFNNFALSLPQVLTSGSINSLSGNIGALLGGALAKRVALPSFNISGIDAVALFPWQFPNQSLALIYLTPFHQLKVMLESAFHVFQSDSQAIVLANNVVNPITAIDANGIFNIFYQDAASHTGYKIYLSGYAAAPYYFSGSPDQFSAPIALATVENIFLTPSLFANLSLTSTSMTILPIYSPIDISINFAPSMQASLQDPFFASVNGLFHNNYTGTFQAFNTFEPFIFNPYLYSQIPPPAASPTDYGSEYVNMMVYNPASQNVLNSYYTSVGGVKTGYSTTANGATMGYNTTANGAVSGYSTATGGVVSGYNTTACGVMSGYNTTINGVTGTANAAGAGVTGTANAAGAGITGSADATGDAFGTGADDFSGGMDDLGTDMNPTNWF